MSDEEKLRRKARSEAILRRNRVAINPNLPLIESCDEVTLRSATEIAQRAICLLMVAGKCELGDEKVKWLIDRHGVARFFTERERAFLADKDPSDDDRIQFPWRFEAAWPLFWSLGLVRKLDLPTKQARPDKAIAMVEKYRLPGLAARKVSKVGDVLDEADLIYRCHWALRQAALDGTQVGGRLDMGVTIERHQALNWLIRYENAEWDDVATDT